MVKLRGIFILRETGDADGLCCGVAGDGISRPCCSRDCADMAVKPPAELVDMPVGICTDGVRV